MFGRKKMYKKGLADAMKAYEAFGKKQEAALEKIVQDFKNSNKELDAKLKALGEDIIAVYDYLDKSEKAALYKLCTPMDLKELEEPERRLLIAVLCQLADDEGSRYNSDQRKFVNAIRRYLEIPNPQTFADYSAIEEIDSLDIQETIMRVCLEFMYLQDADEMSDDQEAFFDNFAVSKRQAKLIEFDVIRQFHMFGAEGVAEKYGSETVQDNTVSENEKVDEVITDNIAASEKINNPYVGIPLEIADKINIDNNYYETSDYVIYSNEFGRKWFKFDKRIKHKYEFNLMKELDWYTIEINGFRGYPAIDYYENKLYIENDYSLYQIDLKNDEKTKVETNMDIRHIYANQGYVVITVGNIEAKTYIYNMNSGDNHELKDYSGKTIGDLTCCCINNNILYFIASGGQCYLHESGGNLDNWFCAYSLIDKSIKRICKMDGYTLNLYEKSENIFMVKQSHNSYIKIYSFDICNEAFEEVVNYYYDCIVKSTPKYIYYLNKSGEYPIFIFNCETLTTTKIAIGCFYAHNTGLFKTKWEKHEGRFQLIGEWLYYNKEYHDYNSSENTIYRVSTNTPLENTKFTKPTDKNSIIPIPTIGSAVSAAVFSALGGIGVSQYDPKQKK